MTISSSILSLITMIFSIIVFLLRKILSICSCCPRNKRKSILLVSEMNSSIVNERDVETSQPYLDMFHVWEGDAETLERFKLHDMANEKPIRFTAEHLSCFTNNYSEKLGSGGFGVVYGGLFPNGVKVAVKVLKKGNDKKAEEQFMAEVRTIGRTYHVNLVRLYGFCFDNSMTALVYEFMENGSLDNILFKENPGIECDKLYEIAIGTAKGLAYLHEECERKIIHYDIKPGNVLLDVNFSPKVADFGLANLCNKDDTHESPSGYRGTPGYSAPEFLLQNYAVSYKCDVYSYGMLLFEIVRKRRNFNVGPADSFDWFPKRAWEEYEKDGLGEIISMECGIKELDKEKAERMFMVALWCVQDLPDARPSMSMVVRMLEGGVQITPPSQPFQYLYSVAGANVSGTDLYSSAAGRTNESTWYKDSAPIISKYEIQIVRKRRNTFFGPTDSPAARPLMSTVVRMLEGGVQIMPPPKRFQYLYSVPETNIQRTDSYSCYKHSKNQLGIKTRHQL